MGVNPATGVHVVDPSPLHTPNLTKKSSTKRTFLMGRVRAQEGDELTVVPRGYPRALAGGRTRRTAQVEESISEEGTQQQTQLASMRVGYFPISFVHG